MESEESERWKQYKSEQRIRRAERLGWKQYKSEQKIRRAERLPERQKEIEALSEQCEVKKLTEFQYRINGVLDLYPTHNLFHHITKNKRGNYKAAIEIVKKFFNINK